MRIVQALVCASAALTLAAPAAAGPAHPFVMPDLSPSRTVGAEVIVGRIDLAPLGGRTTVIALEPTLALPLTPRWTLTGRVPVGHATSSARSGTTLGNLTVGALYVISARGRRGDRTITAVDMSLSLPTAADGGDAGAAARTHARFRVPDAGLYNPKTTTARVHGNWRT
jgi:hypothetical protein